MNQYLKTIGDLLQQNERLAQQEREVLLKAIADADKQWSIIDFKLERTEKVKRTTTVLLEETIAELDQKRKAIEEQNRELEIEGALERVRSVAMGMKKPEDMLDVCKVISQQLSLLNVKEIRNVQTAIFYDEKGFYANYEYYAKHDKLFITDTEFRNHPVAEQFASQMMKGPNEVFIHSFSGKEVRDWLGYQKSTNVFIDSYLETASSLNYYWYSLGPVALGMSTYVPLEENEIDLFKRFRNVFELAYRRYLDIEKAEAQAKEAQIEAALERVRARTMAMHKSEDLGSIALELFRELLKFGGGVNTCGFVLCDRDKTEDEYWVCWESGIQPPMLIPHTTDPTCINLYKGWEMGEEYYVEEKSGEELKAHFDYLMTVPSVRRVFENWLQMSGRFPSRQRWHAAYFKYGFVFVITDQPYPEEQIFKRFAPVFGQAYTRFLDLKKAEAQAKEAKIEAALEKVRARTMGMQRSDELADTAVLLFQQLKLLDVELRGCGFNIWEKDEKTCTAWMSTPVGELMQPFSLPLTEYPLFIRYYESRKNGEDFWVQETSKKELSARLGYLSTLPVVGELLTGSPNNEAAIPAFVVDHVVNFSNGNLIFITYKPYPEAHDIFKRFGKVFDQTYTRFLDLQKAETQAREAQVEAALEKVRSRSLAMHKSDELEQVVTVVNEKLRELGVSMEDRAASMIIFEEGSKDLVQWVASQEHETSSYFRTPYFDHPIFNDLLEAKEKGVDFFYKAYTPKVKNSYFRYFFEHSDYKLLPDSTKKWILESEHYALSIAYAKHSALAIVNLSGKPLSENQNDILKRFSRVFEQSYTRFLDLQKAEAQAKESQIQLALERVRARTMAMHQSAELIEVLTVLMQQLNELKFDIDLTSIHPNFSEQPFIYWMASVTRPYPEKFDVPYKDIPFMKKFRQAAQLKKEVLNIHFEKK